MELKGKVIAVLPLQSGVSRTGNEWKKQEFVVETQEQYPKKVCLSLFNKIEMCPVVGEDVVVHINIESHEHNGRWFTQVNAWKIDKGAQEAQGTQSAQAAQGVPNTLPAQQSAPSAQGTTNTQPTRQSAPQDDDVLPF